MLDPKAILDDFLGSRVPGTGGSVRGTADKAVQMARENPLAAGAIAAVLLGTGPGRSIAGSALKLGGLAAIGGLAYKAYQNYQKGNEPAAAARDGEVLPPPADTGFHAAAAPQGEAEFARTLVRAMIAAAKSDGHVDEAERARIGARLHEGRMDPEAEKFILAELDNPAGIDELVAEARTEEQKVELYTASRLAVDPDSRAERGYLDMLAGRLQLSDGLIDHIEATISADRG